MIFLHWLQPSASDGNNIYHQIKSPSVNIWHHLLINSADPFLLFTFYFLQFLPNPSHLPPIIPCGCPCKMHFLLPINWIQSWWNYGFLQLAFWILLQLFYFTASPFWSVLCCIASHFSQGGRQQLKIGQALFSNNDVTTVMTSLLLLFLAKILVGPRPHWPHLLPPLQETVVDHR